MSYEVTATRRRPQTFDALAGQEFVAETLRNSIATNKIAHAYLFSGPRGCGKTSTARILAKALNCEHGPTATPCGKCQQCVEITKGQSTDVIEIDGASNTSVNDIRQIKDEVLFPPQSSRYKIYIIDEVHMLSTSAFNALLKTIEEPPAYCIFIFATTELHKVPATIKSRCQQFNFRLVPIEKVKEELAEAAKEIGIQADDEALYWVARESTGSMRDAYTLFDQVAAFSGNHLTYDKIRDKLGLVGIESLNAIFEDAAENKAEDALLKIDGFLQNGISIEQFITNCTEYLRSLLLIKSGVTKESLLGHPKERFSEIVLKNWNSIQTERALSIMLQLFRDIRYSLSPRYELELAFSRLSWLAQYVSPSEVKRAIDEAKNLLLSSGQANFSTQSAAPKNSFQTCQSQTFQRNFFQQAGNAENVAAGIGKQNPENVAKPPVSNAGSNPFIGRTVSLPDGQASPRNIFAQASGQEQNVQTRTNGNISQKAVQTQPPQISELDESFAPPDPTPDTAPSFSDGGAEPPEQTGGFSFNQNDSSSPSDFRGKILKELLLHEPLLATALNQTGEWTKNGNIVSTVVKTSFMKIQLDSKLKKISEILSNYFGEKISFQVVLQEQQRVNAAETAPANIKMICEVFRGQIVGHSKKTEQEIAESRAEKHSEDSKSENEQDSENLNENSSSESEEDDE